MRNVWCTFNKAISLFYYPVMIIIQNNLKSLNLLPPATSHLFLFIFLFLLLFFLLLLFAWVKLVLIGMSVLISLSMFFIVQKVKTINIDVTFDHIYKAMMLGLLIKQTNIGRSNNVRWWRLLWNGFL